MLEAVRALAAPHDVVIEDRIAPTKTKLLPVTTSSQSTAKKARLAETAGPAARETANENDDVDEHDKDADADATPAAAPHPAPHPAHHPARDLPAPHPAQHPAAPVQQRAEKRGRGDTKRLPPTLRSECYEDMLQGDPAAAFAGLHLASLAPLEAADALPRVPCPRCQHPGKHYCKNCLTPLLPPPHALPTVALPVPLIIIKHGGEANTKSTAVHAAILAPEGAHLVAYPTDLHRDTFLRLCGSDPTEPADAALARIRAESVMLYPASDATTFAAMAPEARASVRRIFVIDGTWSSVKKMVTDLADCLGGPMRALTLANAGRTHFWRPNGTDNASHLSTIEAVHVAYREYASAQAAAPADVHQLDNLLYLFAHQHRVIGTAMVQKRASVH